MFSVSVPVVVSAHKEEVKLGSTQKIIVKQNIKQLYGAHIPYDTNWSIFFYHIGVFKKSFLIIRFKPVNWNAFIQVSPSRSVLI